jgi:hypothetical protein
MVLYSADKGTGSQDRAMPMASAVVAKVSGVLR